MFTDIVGYTSLSQKDEALAMRLLDEHRAVIRPYLTKHNGREVKTMGDAFLVEFASALEAVRCAYDIQQAMHEMNSGRPEEREVRLRVGIHVGDVIHSQDDVYGDAVNVASRIEPLATPGGICVSEQVYYQVKSKFEVPFLSMGRRSLKNVDEPVEVYRAALPWEKRDEEESSDGRRIAILPFANFSPDPNDEYFASGLTEEIISTVSGISGLSVISRTSVMGYKGTSKKVDEIGRELGVGSVLEGSFRKAGNRIRVTTQLIDVARDRHLWVENYDRDFDDVFAVQSDVAKRVAEALRVKILSPEMERIDRRPTGNTTAYTLYLKGRYFWNSRELEDVNKAVGLFEQAVKEDPGFALGYVGLADCFLILRNNWGVGLEENLDKAKKMVAKALELDPGLAEAHATSGLALMQDFRLRESEEEFRKAIEVKPSYAMAHMWYYLGLLDEGRWDEALEQIEKALELDPLSIVINNNHASFYAARGDYTRALELAKRVHELAPDSVTAHSTLATIYGKLKMFDEMRREFSIDVELLRKTYPLARLAADAMIAYEEGDKERMRSLIPELESHLNDKALLGMDNYSFATGLFFLGDIDKGFEFLEKSYSAKEGSILSIKIDRALDMIRSDPRYLDLLKRLGLG